MTKTINEVLYDTNHATNLGCKYVGEFGHSEGFEEGLFVTEAGQHFIYGMGGEDSLYKEPEINLITNKQADKWKRRTV